MSVTAIHLPYKKDLEPIVRPLENVAVARDLDESTWEYFKVKYVEPILHVETTQTITAGGSIDLDVKALELHKDVLGQVRIAELTSGFELEVRLPEATKRYATKNAVGRIDSTIVANYQHLTEITYLGSDYPKFTVFNMNATDGAATIRFVGFKYILERLPSKPSEFTVIYVFTVTPRSV